MEPILIFLTQAVVSGTVSHYIGKGLDRIHPDLASMFRRKAETSEIETFVKEQGIEEELTAFATEAIASSYVIPSGPRGQATLSTRAELFADVLEICFDVSHAMQADLMLPGSFLGSHAFTLFARNKKGTPGITTNGTVLKLDQLSLIDNQLFVFPVGKDGKNLWDEYVSAVRRFRATTNGWYFDVDRRFKKLKEFYHNCKIEQVSAGALRYSYASPMTAAQADGLDLDEGSVPVQGEHNGLEPMLSGLSVILSLDLLNASEEAEINRIYDTLTHLRDRNEEA